MTHYVVNATLIVPASIEVDADSPQGAEEDAADYSAAYFDYDLSAAEVQFDVTPAVEPVS